MRELEPGMYWLSFQQSVNVRPEFVRRPIETSFTVVAANRADQRRNNLRKRRAARAASGSEIP